MKLVGVIVKNLSVPFENSTLSFVFSFVSKSLVFSIELGGLLMLCLLELAAVRQILFLGKAVAFNISTFV
jgi:hypothetical protein